ncbi:efflux RND transporter permease subunit [bacterium]|nr:efflux RND transporter permease subunit [bacterium]
MHLAQHVVKRPVAVVMFYTAILLLGGISLSRLPVDLLPDLAYPKLTVQTTFRDAPPEEVERLITRGIESVMATVPGLRNISSISSEGLSVVTLEFTWGQDMDFAALHVREKLDRLGRLPDEAEDPVVIRLDPSSQAFMGLSVTGNEADLPHLADLTRNVFKRRLEQIDGVALARVTGGPVREIHVDINPEKLEHLGLTVDEIAQKIRLANQDMPGGSLLRGRYRFSLRTLGAFQDPAEIASTVIRHGEKGHRILLSEIAEIKNEFRETESITRYNGAESIGLLLQKEAGANTVRAANKVQEILSELREQYPKVQISVAFNQAGFIQQAISNLLTAIALGGILAFLVLFVFLHDARHPIAVGIAIPIAVIATFTLLHFSGVTLNLMSLGGLALGVGMLVDASIVVLENIFRHHEEGADLQSAAVSGTREVAMAVTASTFTTIAVFLPVLYVKGVAGQLFHDQALTVTFSLLASLLVSLTLLPVMAARFKKPSPLSHGDAFFTEEASHSIWLHISVLRWISWPFRMLGKAVHSIIWGGIKQIFNAIRRIFNGIGQWLSKNFKPLFDKIDIILEKTMRHYEIILEKALMHRGLVLSILGLLLVATFLVGSAMDRELLPKVDQGEFVAELLLPPGASLETVSQSASRMEAMAMDHPGVADVFTRIGRIDGTGESQLNRAQLRIRIAKGESTQSVMTDLRISFSEVDGNITMNASQSVLGELLGQAGGDVEIRLIGNDLAGSMSLIDTVRALTKGTGLTDIIPATALARPEIRIQIDRKKAGRYNLSVYEIASFIKDRVAGTIASQYKAFDQKIDIRVRPANSRETPIEKLLDARIPSGPLSIPLRELVSVSPGKGTTAIHRENQARLLRLSGRVENRGLDQAVADAEKRLTSLASDKLRIEIGGIREEMAESYKSLILAAVLAAALVFMIMAAQFESLRHPLVILFSVPMAGIGAIWLLFVCGQSINVIALIGIVVLVGIAVNDAIVKVDFINQNRRRGMPVHEALMEAGRKRFRPIIMTSVTTILGLLPLAIGFGEGAELQRPLALSIIGGLITSTGLTLICIPVIYSLMEKKSSS